VIARLISAFAILGSLSSACGAAAKQERFFVEAPQSLEVQNRHGNFVIMPQTLAARTSPAETPEPVPVGANVRIDRTVSERSAGLAKKDQK